MQAEKLKKYSFVTATVVDSEYGLEDIPVRVRQGVLMGTLPNNTVIITGLSGDIYCCSSEVQEVADHNLDAGVLEFVRKIRDLNR